MNSAEKCDNKLQYCTTESQKKSKKKKAITSFAVHHQFAVHSMSCLSISVLLIETKNELIRCTRCVDEKASIPFF
jgi:hypothetical protein